MGQQQLFLTLLVATGVLASPATVRGEDHLAGLIPESVASVRIQLNAGGASPGFTVEIAGDDPAVRELVELIRVRAEPARDHRCSNRGFVHFLMADGSALALGLLPGHTEGSYELRVYRAEVFVALFRVDRAAFLTTVGELGVPLDHAAFQE